MVAPSLLATKFHAPQPRPGLVSRARLLRRLDEGLQPGKRLILISAPAGYGKTTLAGHWLAETHVPSAWLSLDDTDNDPVRFLQYLLGALRTLVPSIQVDLPDSLQATRAADRALLGEVINETSLHGEPFILILDDFHVIHAQAVLEIVAFLLDHMPPQMHLVLLSRSDPLLPLSRLRARDQLIDIRADQLRFLSGEIAYFLNTMMALGLSGADILAIEARTEGWIAGLQLAALSMQNCADVHEFVSALTGSHRYIMDYLVEEVLKQQPPLLRSFLLQTSILSRMCGALCSAIVETDTHEVIDGQAVLEMLEQMNLFLVPLDSERRWYRYHHLFADVLNRHAERELAARLPDLHRRTAHWYEQNDMITEAIKHALLAGDQEHAAQLMEQNGCLLLMAGEVVTLLRWVEAVTVDALQHPWLSVLKGWALALCSRFDEVEQYLLPAERVASTLEPSGDLTIMLAAIASARAYCAVMQQENSAAARFARQALDGLPEDNVLSSSLRGVATSILGDASWMEGRLQEAAAAYVQAALIGKAAGNRNVAILANSNLGDVLLEQGLLRQAATTYTSILQMTARSDGRETPLAESAYAGLSRVSYEWNQLEAARQYARRCVDLCQQWGDAGYLAFGHLMLSQIAHAQGDPESAGEELRMAEQLADTHPLAAKDCAWLQGTMLRLWVACGDVQKGARFIQDRTDEAEPASLRAMRDIARLRVLLAQRDYAPALALAGETLRNAQAAGRRGSTIEILVLQALAWLGHNQVAQASAAIAEAIALAEADGFVRVFLDEGDAIAGLLHRVSAGAAGRSAQRLLSSLGAPAAPAGLPAQPLAEPLSPRELEVLLLIASGCSNQDIAARLVISVATVKRHISNIYGKLAVETRTQAVALSRELHLLD